MEREQAARRTKAALALAGYRNVEDLAAALDGSGVGLKRLREIYQQRGNEPRSVEMREIAEACRLPYEFFTVDLATLAGSGGDRIETLEERVSALADLVARLSRRIDQQSPMPARAGEAQPGDS